MAFSVFEVIRVACVSCTGVDSTTLQTSHNNDFVNAKSNAREKWGREMVGNVLDLHWESEQQQKKTGETEFLSRAVI